MGMPSSDGSVMQKERWADWSVCDRACGGGHQERTREVTTPTIDGGVATVALEEEGAAAAAADDDDDDDDDEDLGPPRPPDFDEFLTRGQPKHVTFMVNRHFVDDCLVRPPKDESALPAIEVEPVPLLRDVPTWWRPSADVSAGLVAASRAAPQRPCSRLRR